MSESWWTKKTFFNESRIFALFAVSSEKEQSYRFIKLTMGKYSLSYWYIQWQIFVMWFQVFNKCLLIHYILSKKSFVCLWFYCYISKGALTPVLEWIGGYTKVRHQFTRIAHWSKYMGLYVLTCLSNTRLYAPTCLRNMGPNSQKGGSIWIIISFLTMIYCVLTLVISPEGQEVFSSTLAGQL